MLHHRWRVAGGDELPFTHDAIEQMYVHSEGVPRTQVILAGNALLAAYLRRTDQIGPDDIQAIVRDRGLPDVLESSPAVESLPPKQRVLLQGRT